MRMWRAGDLDALASLSVDDESNPDRAEIALLNAAAFSATGDNINAERALRRALAWGADERAAAGILIASAHHTLGRLAALNRDNAASRKHFESAALEAGDAASAAQEIMVRELVSLGLLPQASEAIATVFEKAAEDIPDDNGLRARFDVLRSKIRLLRHELSIAQERRQLYSAGRDEEEDETFLPKERSFAQLGQDLWALEMSGNKRGGYFVEFGATDGLSLSNTYLLEKDFEWTGLLAEPNPEFFEILKKNRRAVVTGACIAASTGEEVEFVFADEFGGIADFCDDGAHRERRDAYRKTGAVARLKTISLNDFLKAHDAPHDIDYISVDTEGSEFDILNAFPFERWNVRCWTVEHNFTPNRQRIYDLMRAHGYQRTEAQWDDWYYRA